METYEDKELIELLKKESCFSVQSDTLRLLLRKAKSMIVAPGEEIIGYGGLESRLFILRKGLTRLAYTDTAGSENTIGFSSPATLIYSPIGWFLGLPAFFYVMSCTECELLVVAKPDVEQLIGTNADLARWLFGNAIAQMACLELKQQHSSTDAKSRYKDIISRKDIKIWRDLNIPDHGNIVPLVTDKIIASYLGITPIHLSRIKKLIILEEREQNRKSRNKT